MMSVLQFRPLPLWRTRASAADTGTAFFSGADQAALRLVHSLIYIRR